METLKSLFNSIFSTDLNREVEKAKTNRDNVKSECEKKVADAESAFQKASADIKEKEIPRGGKSGRKGTRKPKGKKNKRTRRN